MNLTVGKKEILLFEEGGGAALEIGVWLRQEGYLVSECRDFSGALLLLEQGCPDLVILDLTSAVMDGFLLCRQIRGGFQGYLMVLSPRLDDAAQVLCLEMGADDYLGKPLNPSVVLARIRALLRRDGRHKTDRISLGELTIDPYKRQACRCGDPVDLTTKEFDLLWLLAKNAGSVLTRQDIHRKLFCSDYNGIDRTVDIYISRIRKKIENQNETTETIKTVRGSGYLLALE